jgi:ABC-type multidrug transport system permease subunit
MSRNLYILAATLAVFALLSAGMALVPVSVHPQLPTNGALWRTAALILVLTALVATLVGVMSHLFEQVHRRNEEAGRAERQKHRDEKN